MLTNMARSGAGGGITEFTATNESTSTCKFTVPALVGKSGFVMYKDTTDAQADAGEYFCIWFGETQKVAGSARYSYTPTFDPATGTVTIDMTNLYMPTAKGWCW